MGSEMRILVIAVAVACLGIGTGYAFTETAPTIGTETAEHGGGCRKDSPPGQCCHMDRKTGVVHCH